MSALLASARALPLFYHLAAQCTLVALRGMNTAGKLVLTLYMVSYIGLADLGVYGLLVGASIAVPAIFGFGLTDWTARQVVGLGSAEALPRVTTRLLFTLLVHLIGQPLAWIANALLGYPIPANLVIPIALILLLEHLGTDAHAPLVARDRVLFAHVLYYFRAGLWPLVAVSLGLFYPGARTLECILFSWLGGLTMMWLLIAVFLMHDRRWRWIEVRWDWLPTGLRSAWPFYVTDVGAVVSLYFDRFLVSAFLGLEATGVYTFFWSAANVVHTLAAYGIVQSHAPKLIAAAKQGRADKFVRLRRQLLLESWSWAALLSIALCLALYLALPLLGRPLLEQSLSIFWLIMLATVLRIVAEGYHFILYAMHKDRAMAAASLMGMAASAALNTMLVPMLGLFGAGFAYTLAAAALLVVRRGLAQGEKFGASHA